MKIDILKLRSKLYNIEEKIRVYMTAYEQKCDINRVTCIHIYIYMSRLNKCIHAKQLHIHIHVHITYPETLPIPVIIPPAGTGSSYSS